MTARGWAARLGLIVATLWCAAQAACGADVAPSPATRRGSGGQGGGAVEARPGRDAGAPERPPVGADASGDLSPLLAPLEAEEREANPGSPRVKLQLTVLPVEAEVFWGRKKLGLAGRTPLELERPRDSGPLDLVVRAPGYLPYHTRLHTDRDDRLTLRLVSPTQARGLLGWKPSGAAPAAR